MQLARVIGRVTATVKHPSLSGQKLLLLQPLLADGTQPDGDPQVAVDHLGAGAGDMVLITSDGPTVRDLLKDPQTPVRWSVLGIRD